MNLKSLVEIAKSKFDKVSPYSIQVSFVSDMIECMSQNKIGFFESPTGTGKSMSVLTSTTTLIQQKNIKIKENKLKMKSDADHHEEDTENSRLIVCTRTHSQIKELVKEFKNHKKLYEYSDGKRFDKLKIVSIASRRHLCIQDKYAKLSANDLNNVCPSECEYYDKEKFSSMTSEIKKQPFDIEDLISLGRTKSTCPYYSSRNAIKSSDIILMPYQSLFSKETRDALSLDLKNSYIVIDEAHNLVDALNAMNTLSISNEEIDIAFTSMAALRSKLAKSEIDISKEAGEDIVETKMTNGQKVNPEKSIIQNRNKEGIKHIQKLIEIASAMRKLFSNKGPEIPEVTEMNPFQDILKISSINTLELVDWATESRLVYRATRGIPVDERLKFSEPLRKFLKFVDVMGNQDRYGRVVFERRPKDGGYQGNISYMLLNPSMVFKEITESPSIVLVGGTLKPFDDLKAQLIDKDQLNRVYEHANGHIIPPSNSLTIAAPRGPLGSELRFTADRRDGLYKDLKKALIDTSKTVPGGVIFFFTSFEFMNKVWELVQKDAETKGAIENHKLLVREEKDPTKLDSTMRLFKSHVDNLTGSFTGAVLFAVMNGKLSEGINFKDAYCRCVVCVGLPFPNPTSVEVRLRRQFFDDLKARGLSECNGQQFVENTCMRAVNQSIGRAFRHRGDFAAVVLFDVRYDEHRELLPGWIQRNYRKAEDWSQVVTSLEEFFVQHK